jgi:predicted nuclease with TOPRIM domain
MQYTPLVNSSSTPHGSTAAIDSIDNSLNQIVIDRNDYYCGQCKNKLIKKQETNHTPIECLSQRCELLENEAARLKDHDIKSHLRIRDLENKITILETAIKSLTTPKLEEATPYSFGTAHKLKSHLRKTYSEEVTEKKSEKINYDHILQPKRSNDREHAGLFGSRGLSSQKPH